MQIFYYSAIQIILTKDVSISLQLGKDGCTEIKYIVFPNGEAEIHTRVNNKSHRFLFHEKNVLLIQTVSLGD